MTRLEMAIALVIGTPIALWFACVVINAQWLIRKRMKRRMKK